MPEGQPLVVLFADVCESVKLFERYGNVQARRLIAGVLDALCDVVARHEGRLVKTIGDEIMCTFAAPTIGVHVAAEMHKRIALDPDFARDRLAVRIGLHYGNTLLGVDRDVYDETIIIATGMVQLARRDQIITTASTTRLLTKGSTLRMRPIGRACVAGKSRPIDIVDVIWQDDESHITAVQHTLLDDDFAASRNQLQLRYRGRVVELEPLSPAFKLGRDEGSSLVVIGDWVSRNHALIEYKRGGFTISDRSMNGTYVKLGDDEELRLYRDELRLRKGGMISLGAPIALNPDQLLSFRFAD